MHKVRIDKWLWSVRIFKSRSLATQACKSGKVQQKEQRLKPSAQIQVGDRVAVRKNGFHLQFEVLKLINKRVGAPLAVECYIDHTPEEELNKYKDWFIGKAAAEVRMPGEGRPTKKERREIDSFKFTQYDYWDED